MTGVRGWTDRCPGWTEGCYELLTRRRLRDILLRDMEHRSTKSATSLESSLDATARVVGPMLGGLLLGGTFFQAAPMLGAVLGALVGAVAGLVRNREIARGSEVAEARH